MAAISATGRTARMRPRIEHMSEPQENQTLEKDPADW